MISNYNALESLKTIERNTRDARSDTYESTINQTAKSAILVIKRQERVIERKTAKIKELKKELHRWEAKGLKDFCEELEGMPNE